MPSKNKQVKVLFKPNEFANLEQLAKAKGVSKAEWIRQKIGASFDDVRPPRHRKIEKSVPTEVLYLLNKIGSSIGNLAAKAYIDKALDRQILETLVRIENELKAFL